eukprot:3739932-Pleurochrysis_carterae.AAC.2
MRLRAAYLKRIASCCCDELHARARFGSSGMGTVEGSLWERDTLGAEGALPLRMSVESRRSTRRREACPRWRRTRWQRARAGVRLVGACGKDWPLLAT